MSNQPIFLTGVYRSGTTLLRLMLNAHSRIAIPVESHFLSEFIYDYQTDRTLKPQEIRKIAQCITNHARFKHWQTSTAQLMAAVSKINNLNLSRLIDQLYRLETGHQSPRWGDKTPGYERHLIRLAEVFPAAKFIHIHRDGRDVSNSLRDRNWHGITEFQRANYWQKSMQAACSASKQLGPKRCLNIQYEQLVKSPETTLKMVCAFLGEVYEPQMMEFNRDARQNVVDNNIHTKLIRLPDPERDLQRWQSESSNARILLFEALADKSLLHAGYQLHFGPIARKLAKLTYWLPGLLLSKIHESYLATPTRFRAALRENGMIKAIRNLMYRRHPSPVKAKSA